jgi:hypothetical protein
MMTTEGGGINMNTGTKWGRWLAVTLIVGIAAFITSPNAPLGGFWAHLTEGHSSAVTPTGVQMLFLIMLTVIQSLAFGLGTAFLLFGWPYVNAVTSSKSLGQALYLAVSWSLISWWPHTNLHQVLGAGNINSLLAIEYGFHVTLILGGIIVAYFLLTKMRQDQI